MEKRNRVFAFIDSQNLNLSIRALKWQLDYKKFRIYLKDKYKVSKAYLFIGLVPGNDELYNSLKRWGYNLIFKPTVGYTFKGKYETKGNVDSELVLYASSILYRKYDKAVIITGDGDFYCLIDFLRKKRKLLKLIIPNHTKYSSLLKEFMPKIHYVSYLRDKLEYIKNERH